MTEQLYILTWLWVAAGKSFRHFIMVDYKENYDTEYTQIRMTGAYFN